MSRSFFLLLCAAFAFIRSAYALPTGYDPQVVLSTSDASGNAAARPRHGKVLILGGGVAGVMAARALHDEGVSDFVIVEARDQLGGRMMSYEFGAGEKKYTVELGANWIHGTQTGNSAANPIWELAQKHNLSTSKSHYLTSITTYDESGEFDFRDLLKSSITNFEKVMTSAGFRAPKRLVDMSARSGYALTGARSDERHAMAAEWFQFDYEFGARPEDSSWIAASWNHNNTFVPAEGGFSGTNLLAVDQRGFKTLVQAEAEAFLRPEQLMLNSTVETIATTKRGVRVVLTSGEELTADYALCTFSLGVLQHDDVRFEPELPAWKKEAIHSMTMGTYTKIFMQFPEKFWFDTEFALYADYERGRYPVWQSLDHPGLLPGSGILFVTVIGEFSRRLETLPDARVQAEVLSVLQAMYPNVTVPAPSAFLVPRWAADARFRGSYANWPASFLSEHQANLRANVAERLWFAGEATSRRWFGFLHGAYAEGVEMGRALAECVKGGGCVGLEHVEWVENANPYEFTDED